MRVPFNDDNTNKGVEGFYEVLEGKLVVYLKPTNSKADWLTDFNALPKKNKDAHCWIHRGYAKYSEWIKKFLNDLIDHVSPDKIYLFGYSMGGGLAQIVGEYTLNKSIDRIISIDGPKTTSRITSNIKLYYNRGSIVNRVPFWFKRIKNAVCLNRKWQCLKAAHEDYDIDEIINKEIR